RNPDRTAWENIRFGFKNDAIAKRAVWGNMTPEMRRQFPGGVDTVTSGDFTRLWEARYDGDAGLPEGSRPSSYGGTGAHLEDRARRGLVSDQRTAPRYVPGTRRDVAAGTTDFTPGERGQTDWGQVATEHAPAIGSTIGAIGGGAAGGPAGAVAGGAVGG